MTSDERHQHLAGLTLAGLADVLAALDESIWETASLCAGWRIREVVAHMSTAARYSTEEFMTEVSDVGGEMGVLIERIARRDADLSVADLIASLRSPRLHAWAPPGGGAMGALSHAVIHSLDLTHPLGLAPVPSTEAIGAVLDALAEGGVHRQFGADFTGTRLVANDLEWAWGEGEPVVAPAAELVLLLSGRQLS